MATEPAELVKTADEIFLLPDRSEQVIEAARLMEFALREYAGDYRSGLTQLYNNNRKIFPKEQREKLPLAFEVRAKVRNVPKHGDASFEDKTSAAESFILAAHFLFQSFPNIYPARFIPPAAAPPENDALMEQGFAPPNENQSGLAPNRLAESVDDAPSDAPFVPPTFSLPEKGFFEKKLSITQMEKICHRMGRSLKAGISITVAWENEAKLLNGTLRDSFESILTDIANGGTAADAVAAHKCFPSMFAEMVRVGEETGRLDQAFLRLADHYRNLVQMRRTFIQGITWPMLQLVAAIGVITLFFLIVAWLESSMSLFKAPDIFMLGLSPIGNLFLFWTLILMGSAGIFVAVKGTAAGWFGDTPMRLALRIPLVGNTIKTLSLSRFAWSFGMAIESGMDATRAIRLGVKSTQMHYYMAHEEEIAETVGQGKEFVTALSRTDAFPEDLLQAVQVGELTGELTESLERLSDDYREQAELSLRKISQITGFMIFLLVAGIIGIAVILMYANYLGTLNNALTNPMGTVEQIQSGEKSSNPVIAAKNEAVKNFMENNEDFKKIKSIYEHLGNINKMSPNEFLDGF